VEEEQQKEGADQQSQHEAVAEALPVATSTKDPADGDGKDVQGDQQGDGQDVVEQEDTKLRAQAAVSV